ncbi:MAG TPA: glycosyltransferase [Actinomycetota bacterium]|nr:glycosyltransferase [Actinomycetota bacterium]
MTKVVLVGPGAGTRGGIAQFNAHLAAALQAVAQVTLVTFHRLYPSWTTPGRAESAAGADGDSAPVLVAWKPWTWWRAARRVDDAAPDVVVLQWWHPAFGPCLGYVAARARRRGAAVVFVCHNARPHEAFPASRLLTVRALRHADLVLTPSRTTADELVEVVPGAPIEALSHPAYDLGSGDGLGAEWAERMRAPGPVILFFGYVRAYKGLEDLVRALPAIRRAHPGATVVVAGVFHEALERYAELAEQLGVSDALRLYPGYVPSSDVPGLLAAADVVALPYRSASQSGVLPQALARGARVVATDVGAISEALAGHGVLVPPRDPDALADGVVRALASPRPAPRAGRGWAEWRDAVARATPGGPVTAPSPLATAARVAGWALVAFFMWRVLADGLGALGRADVRLSLGSFLLSVVVHVGARLVDMVGWQHLLAGGGSRLPLRRVARIYATSEVVRFLPGGALHLAARYRLGLKESIRPDVIVTVMLLDLALRAATGVAVFLVSLAWWPSIPRDAQLLLLLVPLCVVGLHPRVLGFGMRLLQRLMRRPQTGVILPYGTVVRATLVYAAAWVVRGVSFVLLYRSLVDFPADLAVAAIGAFAISWVVGVAVPFAPGGLGVREAVGASLLARLAAPVPALVMIAVRVQSLLVEAVTAVVVVAWDSLTSRRSEHEPPERAGVPERVVR